MFTAPRATRGMGPLEAAPTNTNSELTEYTHASPGLLGTAVGVVCNVKCIVPPAARQRLAGVTTTELPQSKCTTKPAVAAGTEVMWRRCTERWGMHWASGWSGGDGDGRGGEERDEEQHGCNVTRDNGWGSLMRPV